MSTSIEILVRSILWATQNFLPVSTQELRVPIPHKQQQDLDIASSEAGKTRSREKSCVHTGMKMPPELSHFLSHGLRKVARHSTAEHEHASAQIQNYNITNKKCARLCRTVPQWKSAFSLDRQNHKRCNPIWLVVILLKANVLWRNV